MQLNKINDDEFTNVSIFYFFDNGALHTFGTTEEGNWTKKVNSQFTDSLLLNLDQLTQRCGVYRLKESIVEIATYINKISMSGKTEDFYLGQISENEIHLSRSRERIEPTSNWKEKLEITLKLIQVPKFPENKCK